MMFESLRRAAWSAFGVLAVLVSDPSLAVNRPSTYPGCQTRNVTVSWGASVVVDMSTCHAFGLGTVMPGFAPAHGTATPVEPPGTPVNKYTYQHGGSSPVGGGSDVFRVLDDNSDYIVVNVTINGPSSPIAVSPGTLPTMTAGTAFSQMLTSSGGVGSYTYTLQGGSLPPGLSLAGTGLLSGTPTQRGAYSFTVRSTDSKTPTAQFADKGYSGSVQVPSITLTSTSGTAIQGAAFSQTLAINGGVTPHKCQLETGTFPAGISVSQACVVSGTTAAAPANFPVTLRVTDASTPANAPYFELENYTLTVSPPPSVSITLNPTSIAEDAAGTMTATLTRSLNLSSPTVVNLSVAGTATNGIDFTTIAATASIPANGTTTTVLIDPTTDTTVEANETVSIAVVAGTGYTVGAPSSVVGTINNDDVPKLSIVDAQVIEGQAGSVSVTVALDSPALAGGVNFRVASSNNTALSGTDYTAINLSGLSLSTGQSTLAVQVPILDDALDEDAETFTLTVDQLTGATLQDGSATITIHDNDDPPTMAIGDVEVVEGAHGQTTAAQFPLTLSGVSGRPVSVNYQTSNDSAQAGSDYTAANGIATIPAGQTATTIHVDVTGDSAVEGDEMFSLAISAPANADLAAGQDIAIGTILNDDQPFIFASGFE